MAVNIKAKVRRTPNINVKVTSGIAAQVIAGNGIDVDRVGGNFVVSVDTAGSSVVTGPVGAADNVVPRFDGDGTQLQSSSVTVSDLGVMTVNANAAALPTPPTGTVLHLANVDSQLSRITVDGYGFTAVPAITLRAARGTAAAPAAVQSTDQLGALTFNAYGATAHSATGRGIFLAVATESWTDAAQGTKLEFYTTPTGAASPAKVLTIGEGGTLTGTTTPSTFNQGINLTSSGPATGTAGPLLYNQFTVTHQAPVSGSGFDDYGLFNKQAAGFRIFFNATGALDATASGVVFSTRDTTTAENEVIGGNFTVYSVANTPTSNLYGGVCYVALASGGAKGRIVGLECDVGASPTATLLERVGLGITAIDRKIGTNQDTAIAVYNGSGNNDAAWKTIIQFDNHGGFNPVATDTKFFSSRAAYTIQDIFAASNVTVTGNILDFPHVKLTGPGALTINTTASAAPATLGGTSLFHLVNEGVTYLNLDAIGANKESAIVLRSARGTAASPTATQSGDLLGAIIGMGRGSTGYGTTSGAAIFVWANQTWTDANQGTKLSFYTTPNNTATKVNNVNIENDGGVTIPPSVTGGSKGAGTVNVSSGYYVGGNPMGMVLLNTLTANNSATLDDTTSITSAYDLYFVQIENLVPATNAVRLMLQFSKNAGGAWLNTGYLNNAGGATDSIWINNNATLDNTAGAGLTVGFWLTGMNRTDNKKMVETTGTMLSGAAAANVSGRGFYNTDNDALNGIRLVMSSGNHSTGKVRIWGVRTS